MAQLKDLLVAGTSRFIGEVFFNDAVTLGDSLILGKETDAAGAANNSPALIIGPVSGAHLELDGNELMAKASATSVGPLYINNDGGLVTIGSGGLTVNGVLKAIEGSAASSTTTGALRVTGGLSTTAASWIGGGSLTICNTSDSDSAIVFDRMTAANWKIVDSSATLYFQSDWNSDRGSDAEKGAYETLMKIAHTSGNTTIKGTLYVANGTSYYINGSTSKLNALTTAGLITSGGNVVPSATNSKTLGTSSLYWNGLYVKTITSSGVISTTEGSASSSSSTGAVRVTGGIYASANSFFDATLYTGTTSYYLKGDGTSKLSVLQLASTTASTSTTTGALQVSGGIGVAKTSFFADKIYTGSTTYYIDGDSTSNLYTLTLANTLTVTGAITAKAALSVGTTLTVTGKSTLKAAVSITDGTASTSKTTGALIVTGGIGASGQVNAQSFRIDNAVKFVYNSTDKCVDVIFE